MVVVMPLAYGDWSLVENDFPWDDSAAAAAVLDHNTQLFMSMLTGEIVPMAESAYNIARDREGRAIAGISMGGLESLEIGLLNPDKFAWIGGFSSGVSFLDYDHKLGA